jgi:drug/metabolite transporter (DMT)-like permease
MPTATGAEFVVAFDLPGAGQLGNLTPVVGTLTTVALLGDRPSWPQLVGGGAILAGLALLLHSPATARQHQPSALEPELAQEH